MSEENKIKTGLAVRQFGCHTCMDGEGFGIMLYSGFLDYPGHELDGKEIIKQVTTEKKSGRWGKSEISWKVLDGTESPPEFNSLILLMDYYKLQKVTR